MNIFVGNLASKVTAEDLRRLFSSYGIIMNTIVMKDTVTGASLGYGHVYLVPDEAAGDAITKLNRTQLMGKSIQVRECVYRLKRERRLGKLPWKLPERRNPGTRRQSGHDPKASE